MRLRFNLGTAETERYVCKDKKCSLINSIGEPARDEGGFHDLA
jgi:hypothetical protein